MKRLFLCIILIFMMIFISSCSTEEKDYTVTKENTKYAVDVSEKTISDGTYVYKYTITESKEKTDIKIVYPDGTSYYEMRQGKGTVSGWSHGYDDEKYSSGAVLCDVVVNNKKFYSERMGYLTVAAISAICGVFMILFPNSRLWYHKYAWMFKDAEPSEAAKILHYVLGGIFIVIAIGFALNGTIL